MLKAQSNFVLRMLCLSVGQLFRCFVVLIKIIWWWEKMIHWRCVPFKSPDTTVQNQTSCAFVFLAGTASTSKGLLNTKLLSPLVSLSVPCTSNLAADTVQFFSFVFLFIYSFNNNSDLLKFHYLKCWQWPRVAFCSSVSFRVSFWDSFDVVLFLSPKTCDDLCCFLCYHLMIVMCSGCSSTHRRTHTKTQTEAQLVSS